MSKIAILSFYSGTVERGVETFVFEIATRLSKKNQIVVFQGAPSKYLKYKIKVIKAKAKPPKTGTGPLAKLYLDLSSLKILLFTLKALPELVKGRYDLIFPLNGGWQTLIVRIISKLKRAKMIIAGEAGMGRDDAWNLMLRPDVFVSLTKAQKSWAERIAPEVKTKIIPNGVDLSRFNPQVKPQELPLEKPIAVCTAALVPYKRIDLTIRAVAKAKMSLLLLGDGELKGSLDSLGKRLLGKKYLRLVISYEKMPSHYRAGSVFTLASKTEAFGTAYIEALASNLPVVTTYDDARSEIIGSAGILTDPENIEKYSKDLKIAVSNNYKNRPYCQAQKFSWNNVVSSYQELLKDFK